MGSQVTPRWLVPFGILVGFMGSIAGVGGGLFVTPLLQFALGFPLKTAAATALVLVFATTSASTVTELLEVQPHLFLPVILPLAAGVLVGAQAGFFVAQRIRIQPLRVVFILFLLLSAGRIFFGAAPSEEIEVAPVLSAADQWLAGLVGLAGGFVAPLLGIGGGLLMVPGLLFVFPALGFAGARAGSLAAGSLASLRSLGLHAKAGRVRWPVGLRLGLGALVGAGIGVHTVHLPGLRDIGRPIIGFILVFVALRFGKDFLWPPASDSEEETPEIEGGGQPEGKSGSAPQA